MDDQFLTDMYHGQQTVSVWVFRNFRYVTFFSGLFASSLWGAESLLYLLGFMHSCAKLQSIEDWLNNLLSVALFLKRWA